MKEQEEVRYLTGRKILLRDKMQEVPDCNTLYKGEVGVTQDYAHGGQRGSCGQPVPMTHKL